MQRARKTTSPHCETSGGYFVPTGVAEAAVRCRRCPRDSEETSMRRSVHSLRYQNMFFHFQLFLVVFVHHHDFAFVTFSVHFCVVFLSPRDRHDHLRVASFP